MNRADTAALLLGERQGVAYGVTWMPDDARAALVGVAEFVARVESSALDMVFVDASEQDAAELSEALNKTDVLAVWAVTGVVGRVAAAWGWPEFIRATASTPSQLAAPFARALHDALVEIRAGVASGARAFAVADDLSSTAGWLVSPDFALDAAVPCYRSMAAEIRGAGGAAIFHSDGDARVLFDALARSGFSAVHVTGQEVRALTQVTRAARLAGLVPLGGIAVGGLDELGARSAGVRAAALAAEGPMVVCEDGGMSTVAELGCVIEALGVARAIGESA